MVKNIIVAILNFEAKLVLRKFHPKIIGITGSVGKTSTKEAVTTILSKKFRVRSSYKSYNSELGLPLAILGLHTQWNSVWGWLKNIVAGFLVYFSKDYPEMLILEMGVDRPGDMDKALHIVELDVAVVTAIGEVPVHVEYFSGPIEVAREKGKIVKSLAPGTTAVLNFDDEVVYEMKDTTKGKVITFGFGEESDVRISQYRLLIRHEGEFDVPQGFSIKIDYAGSTVPLRLDNSFGKQQAYAVAAAISVGLSFEMNLITCVEALKGYMAPAGRLRLIEGEKDTLILDDTYNASPLAVHAALDTLQDVPAKRKIAVLGDMLEIGKFTIQSHQSIGQIAKPIVDFLFTVGPRAKFIAEAAREQGMPRDNVFEFSSSAEAGQKLESMLQPGDVILVKGSQSMRMEKVVLEIMRNPELAKELLIRQEEAWEKR